MFSYSFSVALCNSCWYSVSCETVSSTIWAWYFLISRVMVKHENDNADDNEQIHHQLAAECVPDFRYVVFDDQMPFKRGYVLCDDMSIPAIQGIPESLRIVAASEDAFPETGTGDFR